MRLICPECNALYDIADAMIPPEGREVECSACGHVWLQKPADAATGIVRSDPVSPAAAAPSKTMRGLSADLRAAAPVHAEEVPDLGEVPILQRPLPDDVLSILREETARELGARRGTKPAQAAPTKVMLPTLAKDAASSPVIMHTAQAPSSEEPPADWPATTVTRPDLGAGDTSQKFEPSAPLADGPSPDLARVGAAETIGPLLDVVPEPIPAPLPVPETIVAAEPPPIPRRRVSRSLPDAEQLAATIQTEPQPWPPLMPPAHEPAPSNGYRTGVLRALSVAAALLVAYLAGAAWVQSGRAPEAVTALIGGVDHLRLGLQDAVMTILGRKDL